MIRFALGLVAGLVLARLGTASLLLAAPLLAWVVARPAKAVAVGALLGLLLGDRTDEASAPRLVRDLVLPALHRVEGVVDEATPPGPRGQRCVLDLEGLDGRPVWGTTVRLGIGPGSGPVLGPGDRIRAIARLRRGRRRGVRLRGWIDAPRALERYRRARGLRAWIGARRVDAAASLDRRLDRDDAGLARALLLGDRSALGLADRKRFAAAGQGHLIAVSGLHVGLLLAGFLLLLRRAGLRPRPTAALGLVAVLAYVPFAGAPPSAVRAGAGACVFFLARLLGRRASGPCTLAAVAVGVLVLDPAAITDVALLLSLAAVTGILLLAPRLTHALVPPPPYVVGLLDPPRAPFRKAFAVSLSAWLGAAPLLATFLGRLCLVAAPLSVATVPFAAALVASAAVLLLVGSVPGLDVLPALLFGACADGLRLLLDAVPAAGLGAREVRAPDPAWIATWILVLLGLGLGWITRVGHGLLVVAALLLLLLLPAPGVDPTTPLTAGRRRYDAALAMPPLLDAAPDATTLLLLAGGLLLVAGLSIRPFDWLTPPAALAAWALGVLACAAFSWPGMAALFAPFVVANLLGRLPGTPRTGARRLAQVAANGAPAVVGCVVALAGEPVHGAAAFLGALACLGADTCATEIGVRYGGTPRSLFGKALRPGESGGVTPAGLAASVGGAFLAPLTVFALGRLRIEPVAWIALAGVAAGLLDSLLGATLQYRGRDPATGEVVERRRTEAGPTERVSGVAWLDNDAVNLVAGLAGAAIAVGLVA